MGLKRLAWGAAAVWVLRWAALELAAHVGRRAPLGPPPRDSLRPPGWMPGPHDR